MEYKKRNSIGLSILWKILEIKDKIVVQAGGSFELVKKSKSCKLKKYISNTENLIKNLKSIIDE